MQGQYNHGDAHYRCRFPQEYTLVNQVAHPRNVYLREDALTDPLDTWLASAFAPDRIERTISIEVLFKPIEARVEGASRKRRFWPSTSGGPQQAIRGHLIPLVGPGAPLERWSRAMLGAT
ncbi:hypothetical protein [Micromonospora purpureochromogenes]|uniref:hypothetical protein n=1 Tax=Micromonospora purpureochromogenes TaxID=47872 RepID=UPI000B5B094E|nr:hypothetical protein [Micromonospora purpureochromogenes]